VFDKTASAAATVFFGLPGPLFILKAGELGSTGKALGVETEAWFKSRGDDAMPLVFLSSLGDVASLIGTPSPIACEVEAVASIGFVCK